MFDSAPVKEGGTRCSPEVPPSCARLREKGRKLNYGSAETGLGFDEDISETSPGAGDVSLGNRQIPQDG